jgi:hypothetical protein
MYPLLNKKIFRVKFKDLNTSPFLKTVDMIIETLSKKFYKHRAFREIVFFKNHIYDISNLSFNSLREGFNEYIILKKINNKIGDNKFNGIQEIPFKVGKFDKFGYLSRFSRNLHHLCCYELCEEDFLKKIILPLLQGLNLLSQFNVLHLNIGHKNCVFDENGSYISNFGHAILIDDIIAIEKIISNLNKTLTQQIDDSTIHEELSALINTSKIFRLNLTQTNLVNEISYRKHILEFGKKIDVYLMGRMLDILLEEFYICEYSDIHPFYDYIKCMTTKNACERWTAENALERFSEDISNWDY